MNENFEIMEFTDSPPLTEEALKSLERIGIEGNPGRIVRDLINEVRRLRVESMENAARASQYSTHLAYLKVEANSLRDLLRSAYGYVKVHEYEGLTNQALAYEIASAAQAAHTTEWMIGKRIMTNPILTHLSRVIEIWLRNAKPTKSGCLEFSGAKTSN